MRQVIKEEPYELYETKKGCFQGGFKMIAELLSSYLVIYHIREIMSVTFPVHLPTSVTNGFSIILEISSISWLLISDDFSNLMVVVHALKSFHKFLRVIWCSSCITIEAWWGTFGTINVPHVLSVARQGTVITIYFYLQSVNVSFCDNLKYQQLHLLL